MMHTMLIIFFSKRVENFYSTFILCCKLERDGGGIWHHVRKKEQKEAKEAFFIIIIVFVDYLNKENAFIFKDSLLHCAMTMMLTEKR